MEAVICSRIDDCGFQFNIHSAGRLSFNFHQTHPHMPTPPMSRPFRMLVFIFILNFVLMALRVEAVSVVRSHVLIFTVKLISLQNLLKRHPTSEPSPSSATLATPATQKKPWWSLSRWRKPKPKSEPAPEFSIQTLSDEFDKDMDKLNQLPRSGKSLYYIRM
jgi:hypothetical protein